MAARVVSLFGAVAAQSFYFSGPTRFASPQATFLWPDLDSSLYLGYQSTIPAIDSGGALYIADTGCDTRCPCPYMAGYTIQPAYQQSSVLFKTSYPVSGWCVSPAFLSRTYTSPAVLLSSLGVVLTAFPLSPNGTTGNGALGVLALALNGTYLWSSVLPASLPGLQAPTPVLNGTAMAVLTGLGPNITLTLLDGLTGKAMGACGLPKDAPGCSTGLSALKAVAVTSATGADGVWSDYLWIDGTSQPFQPCSMTWVATGPKAGSVVYGVQPSTGSIVSAAPSLSPNGSPSGNPSQAGAANGYLIMSNGSLSVTAVDPTTGTSLWTTLLPRGYNLVAGVSVAGPYMFLLLSYSQWKGCASPVSALVALNATSGAVLNNTRMNRYPDMGSQSSGALFAAVDPSSCPGGDPSTPSACRTVNLWWRESLGWGTYNSYITAASFSGSYYLITTRYDGSAYGTNVAHDDQGQNAVRGCPPSVDAAPGVTGALLLGAITPGTQPYMVIADWAGVQVFVDQQPLPQSKEL